MPARHPRRLALRILLPAPALLLLLAACASPVRPLIARPPEGLPVNPAGPSSALVLGTPQLADARRHLDPSLLDTFARNDSALSLRPPDALGPIDQPPLPPPTIARQRRTTLQRDAQTILFFDRPSTPRR